MPSGVYKRTSEMKTGKYIRTEYHREINRQGHKGMHPITEFKKGRIPWNKGIHVHYKCGYKSGRLSDHLIASEVVEYIKK